MWVGYFNRPQNRTQAIDAAKVTNRLSMYFQAPSDFTQPVLAIRVTCDVTCQIPKYARCTSIVNVERVILTTTSISSI